tara:strand:- start:2284 stop:2958 length:675 start_codon:yes stop_codon:yes gene_type:complete
MKYLERSYYFSVFVQAITLIIQHAGLNISVEQKHEPLKKALEWEYYVSIVEFATYIWIGSVLYNVDEITPRRYLDWFVTTNILLLTTGILFIYEANKENGFKKIQSGTEIVVENMDTFTKILAGNNLMLLSGFLGETKRINHFTGLFAGLFFFVFQFYIMYEELAKKSNFGIDFFVGFVIIWILYAVAYMTDSETKNIMYNLLDLVSKNAFGVYLLHRIGQVAL